MIKILKSFLETLGMWLMICGFYLLIYVSWGAELCKMVYYVVYRIPHRKLQDKFHPVYVRVYDGLPKT